MDLQCLARIFIPLELLLLGMSQPHIKTSFIGFGQLSSGVLRIQRSLYFMKTNLKVCSAIVSVPPKVNL